VERKKGTYGISEDVEVDLAFRFLASAMRSSRRFRFSTTFRSSRMVSNSFYCPPH
jgi:hypothetical protein